MPKSNNNIFLKLKEDKGARAIAITVTVMLLVLTAIIITTVIANRAVKNDLPVDIPDSQPAGVTDPEQDEQPQQPDTPADPTRGHASHHRPDRCKRAPEALFAARFGGLAEKAQRRSAGLFGHDVRLSRAPWH